MIIFTCNDNFESMMTCIYDAWSARLGHSNIRLQTEPIGNLELFCEYKHITANFEKTQKVIRSIKNKISWEAYQWIYAASMSSNSEKLDIIYRFLILGFSIGASVTRMFAAPQVNAIFNVKRKVFNECHQFQEFLRFSRLENQVLFSIIEPKSNIITLLAPHFVDRMPSENWMITDKTRMISIVHPKDHSFFLTPIMPDELFYMENISLQQDSYANLWKTFFQSVSIEARKNPTCQRTHLPLWFRKNMTEFL